MQILGTDLKFYYVATISLCVDLNSLNNTYVIFCMYITGVFAAHSSYIEVPTN